MAAMLTASGVHGTSSGTMNEPMELDPVSSLPSSCPLPDISASVSIRSLRRFRAGGEGVDDEGVLESTVLSTSIGSSIARLKRFKFRGGEEICDNGGLEAEGGLEGGRVGGVEGVWVGAGAGERIASIGRDCGAAISGAGNFWAVLVGRGVVRSKNFRDDENKPLGLIGEPVGFGVIDRGVGGAIGVGEN